MTTDSPQTPPNQRDIANADLRAGIAARLQAEYDEALAQAVAIFGPGWVPSGRHFLLDKDEEERARKSGGRMAPAATVYSASKDGVKKHFTIIEGEPTECTSVEEGFGPLLHENHPTRGFEHNGQWLPIRRFSLYWAGYEPNYRPRTAEQLAAARTKREQRAVEKEAQANPLFADIILAEGLLPNRKGRPR